MNASLRHAPHVSAADAQQPIDELDATICTLARQLNADTYRLLVLIREYDDRFGWARWGFSNCAEWFAWSCGLSASAAREKVRTAQALREMPTISAAFAEGRLSYSKVRALTRVAETRDERALVAYALQATAAQVEDRCREMRNADPERSARVALRAWERRSVTLFRNETRGTLSISVEVPLEEGEVIAKAIARAAEVEDAALGVEFAAARKWGSVRDSAEAPMSVNGWKSQQADALVAVARAYLAAGAGTGARVGARASGNGAEVPAGSTSVADHYQVVVHVDDSVLRGGAGRSDLPIDVVQRLTCDCSLITVVEDDRGTPLDVGRKQRTVSTLLKRALWSRDRHCSFPGCRRTLYVHAHHIHHWANGGATSLPNLTLLCSNHHKLVHEGGFSIQRDADDAIYFRRPDGRVIPRHGYCLEDMNDDFAASEDAAAEGRSMLGQNPSAEARRTGERNPSAEAWLPGERNPSAEVREPLPPLYCVTGGRR